MARKRIVEVVAEEVSAIDMAQMRGDDFVPEAQPVVVMEEQDHFEMSSDDHRQSILNCVQNLQLNFVQICQLLYQAQKLRRYETWGYSSFKEYAHRELGFKYGKAKALSGLWMSIGSRDREMFDRLMSVGWDKANEISRVVNRENLDEWLEKASHMNADELKKEVKAYILSLVPQDAEEALGLEAGALESQAAAVTEETHFRNWGFHYDQLQTVNEAIVAVKRQYPEITSEAECLAMICAEYLAGNTAQAPAEMEGKEAIVGMVSRLCSQHNIEPVLMDREESRILIGAETLKGLIQDALA